MVMAGLAVGIEADARLFDDDILDIRKFRLVKLLTVDDGDGLAERIRTCVRADACDGDGGEFLRFGFFCFLRESR